MNKANKITISRIILSIVIVIILLFPFYEIGVEFPTYLLKGRIVIDLKYIIVGLLFIIASLTDYLDGFVARKYNMVTDFGKLIDTISNKILINSVLIVLACEGKISVIVTVVIIVRDIIVDSLKMNMANKGYTVGEIYLSKIKTITLMIGIILTLFYNVPFELIPLRVSDFLLAVAAILSVITGVKYYTLTRPYLISNK